MLVILIAYNDYFFHTVHQVAFNPLRVQSKNNPATNKK